MLRRTGRGTAGPDTCSTRAGAPGYWITGRGRSSCTRRAGPAIVPTGSRRSPHLGAAAVSVHGSTGPCRAFALSRPVACLCTSARATSATQQRCGLIEQPETAITCCQQAVEGQRKGCIGVADWVAQVRWWLETQRGGMCTHKRAAVSYHQLQLCWALESALPATGSTLPLTSQQPSQPEDGSFSKAKATSGGGEVDEDCQLASWWWPMRPWLPLRAQGDPSPCLDARGEYAPTCGRHLSLPHPAGAHPLNTRDSLPSITYPERPPHKPRAAAGRNARLVNPSTAPGRSS